MPFTFAHPVAVLPLARWRYVCFPALVLGSLSPDFVYFLGGRADSAIGHTWWGALAVNLPLCGMFYAVYAWLWRDIWRDYLPDCLNIKQTTTFRQPAAWLLIFSLSALIGMATHVLMDSFTHSTGYFVERLPVLRDTAAGLPLFKWLQYGGGVSGVLICAAYWLHRARQSPHDSDQTASEKSRFWGTCAVITLIVLEIWWVWQPLTLRYAVTWVIRIIDAWFLAMTALGLAKRVQAA